MPTTPESRIKIQVNNLTKRFGDLTVLDGINFNIKEGELLAIVGPTGCGKTTFLNTLSKLMPATEGEILIDGEEANPKKHNISYVFQEPTCLGDVIMDIHRMLTEDDPEGLTYLYRLE